MRDRPLSIPVSSVCVSVLLQLAHLLTKCLPQFTGPSFQQVECPHPGAIILQISIRTSHQWVLGATALIVKPMQPGYTAPSSLFTPLSCAWVRLNVLKSLMGFIIFSVHLHRYESKSSNLSQTGVPKLDAVGVKMYQIFGWIAVPPSHLFHCQDTSKLATWALSAVFSESLLDFQAFKVSSSCCVSNLSLITEITWKIT